VEKRKRGTKSKEGAKKRTKEDKRGGKWEPWEPKGERVKERDESERVKES